MKPKPQKLPPSALSLAKALRKSKVFAAAARSCFHRTMVWAWETGRREPCRKSALTLESLASEHGFSVPASGWDHPTPRAQRAA